MYVKDFAPTPRADRVQADPELKQQYEEFFKVLNNVLKSLPVREV
jgi:hypothetical protein